MDENKRRTKARRIKNRYKWFRGGKDGKGAEKAEEKKIDKRKNRSSPGNSPEENANKKQNKEISRESPTKKTGDRGIKLLQEVI